MSESQGSMIASAIIGLAMWSTTAFKLGTRSITTGINGRFTGFARKSKVRFRLDSSFKPLIAPEFTIHAGSFSPSHICRTPLK